MTKGGIAAPPRAAWRVKNIAAVLTAALFAACLGAAPGARAAQHGGQTLITIPPADLSRHPAAPNVLPASVPTSVPGSVVAPRTLPPLAMQTLPDLDGTGIAACGALAGNDYSAIAVLLAVGSIPGEADWHLSPQLVLADDGDRHAQALLTATLNGAPALGVATVALDDAAGAVTLLYDEATSFAASFPRLLRAFAPREVEIGISDNSASQPQTAGECGAAAGWQSVIAATARSGESPLAPALAQSLAERLTADTGRPWRVVPPTELNGRN